jgi:hypothetical protein
VGCGTSVASAVGGARDSPTPIPFSISTVFTAHDAEQGEGGLTWITLRVEILDVYKARRESTIRV